jgi:hypothetical protein
MKRTSRRTFLRPRVHVTTHFGTDEIVGVLSEAHRRYRRRRIEMRSSLKRLL